MKRPKTVPIALHMSPAPPRNTRAIALVARNHPTSAIAPRKETNENRPNTRSAHEPRLIGDSGLSAMPPVPMSTSMCQNRGGCQGLCYFQAGGCVHQNNIGMNTAVNLLVAAVELRLGVALLLQVGEPIVGELVQVHDVAELDRLGRAGFGAGRLQATLKAVVTEGAFLCHTLLLIEADHPVRARRDAVAAAVAHVLLDVNRVE